MHDQYNFNKIIQSVKLKDLHLLDGELDFFIEQPEENTQALKLSVEGRGNRSPYTVVRRDGELYIIDGIRRHPIELELFGSDHEVLVWVFQEDLTDEAIQWYRIDRAKNKKLLKTDVVSVFKFLDPRIPNNQGKNTGEDYRRNRIAKEIGVSKSTLNDLLWIDSINPSLLRAVDQGQCTLAKARKDAKAIEEARNQEKELHGEDADTGSMNPVYTATNQTVELESLITCCPCCNRPFSTLDWKDIPTIFNHKRKDNENQTDWLEAVA